MQICIPMSDDLLSTKAVADLFSTTPATINRWVSQGRITPALQMDGTTGARLYRRSDVEALLAAKAEAAS